MATKAKNKNTNPEHIARVLSEIQASVPATLRKNVVRLVPSTPTIKNMVLELLKKPDLPEAKRHHYQTMLDSGAFDKMREVEDPKIAKIIDNFVGREINKAIKSGLLPPRSKMGDIKGLKAMYERLHNKSDKGQD